MNYWLVFWTDPCGMIKPAKDSFNVAMYGEKTPVIAITSSDSDSTEKFTSPIGHNFIVGVC